MRRGRRGCKRNLTLAEWNNSLLKPKFPDAHPTRARSHPRSRSRGYVLLLKVPGGFFLSRLRRERRTAHARVQSVFADHHRHAALSGCGCNVPEPYTAGGSSIADCETPALSPAFSSVLFTIQKPSRKVPIAESLRRRAQQLYSLGRNRNIPTLHLPPRRPRCTSTRRGL